MLTNKFVVTVICLLGNCQNVLNVDVQYPDSHDEIDDVKNIYACPIERQFILHTGLQYVCVSSCGSDQVLNGSTCINVTLCTKPVLSDRQCLDQCPEGHLYFPMVTKDNYDIFTGKYHTTADIKDSPCMKQRTLHLLIGITACALFLYIMFALLYLSTLSFSSSKLMTWFRSLKRRMFAHRKEELLINTSPGDDENGSSFG